jgi:hypothetical protein
MSEPQRHRTQEMIVRAAAEVRLCETIRRSTCAGRNSPRSKQKRPINAAYGVTWIHAFAVQTPWGQPCAFSVTVSSTYPVPSSF